MAELNRAALTAMSLSRFAPLLINTPPTLSSFSHCRGKVSVAELLAQEAGFSYSYSYNGLGASASWLSRHNFLVIDLAAGPVEFGPTVSPSGAVTPVGLPRLMVSRRVIPAPHSSPKNLGLFS